jgi:hypothetical protein
MKHFTNILLLSLSVFLTGCAKPDVKYSDLLPATTATVSGDTMTVHLGIHLTQAAIWCAIPKARIEGQTVYLSGYRTNSPASREFVIRLPASSQPVTVVWVDPDGSHVTVPITK